MNKLTAALLVLNQFKDQTLDYKGRIRLEPVGAKIRRKMDICSLKLIKETIRLSEASSTTTAFQKLCGVDVLHQLKLLMIKYKGCCMYSDPYNSVDVFSKAPKLVESA